MSAEYSVEEALTMIDRIAIAYGSQELEDARAVLAERIKADEVAVPVAVRYFDGKNGDGSQHYVVYSLDRHRANVGAEPLFTHPPAQAAQVDMHPKHGDMHDGCGGYWCDYVQAEYKKPGPITLHESNIVRYVKLGLMCDKCGVERPTAEPVAQHPDDAAVDAFAEAMKAKLTEARAKGRGGWQDKADCPQQRLSDMLRAHIEKGDPRDVANFCMFLHQRGELILPAEPVAQGEAEWLERLKDPETVHALMLRGVIAVPSIRSMVDLRGEVPNVDEVQLLRIAELQEQIAAHLAQPRAVPDGAWPKMELWFFRDLTSAQRLALFALHSLPVDEIGESHVNQKRMLRHLLTATPLPAAQPRAVPDARVASFVEEAGRIISGASFPSGRSLAKAREVCDLALTMLAAAPSPGESE